MRFSFSAVGAALAALATCAAAFPQRPHFGRPHPELYRPGGRYAPRPYYAHPLWVSSAGEDGAPDDSSPEDSGPGSSGSGSGNGGPGNSGPPGGSGPGGSGPSGGNGGRGRSGPPGGNPGRTFTQQLPASLNPPTGARFIISFFAAGTQNYVCNTTGTPTWSLDRPEAFLYPANADAFVPQAQPIGFHFFLNGTGDSGGGRATWTLTRAGARVTTKLLANAPSPDGPANIPWLLTQTTTSSRSAPGNPLQNVGFVVRYSTTSGVAPPADQCTAEKSGIVKRMPYSALYGFFEPAPSSGAGASSSPS